MSFTASYPGFCDNCEERILIGDVCQYEGKGENRDVVHATCPDTMKDIDDQREVCTECWLLKPCECVS